MSMPMLAGVGLLVVCCSSASAAAMMMGGDGDDDKKKTPLGPTGPTGPTGPSAPECDDGYKMDDDDECISIFGAKTIADTSTSVKAGHTLKHNERVVSPNNQRRIYMQGDNNLCSGKIEDGAWKNKICLMSHQVGGTAETVLQDDGKLCVIGDTTKCYETADASVPSGQHRLVVTNDGEFYVDHGDGKTTNVHAQIN